MSHCTGVPVLGRGAWTKNHLYWRSQPKPGWDSLILHTFPSTLLKTNACCERSGCPEDAVAQDAGPWQRCQHPTNPLGDVRPSFFAARLNTGLPGAPRELQLLRDVRNFCNNSQRVLSLEFSSSLLKAINHPNCRTSAITQPLGLSQHGRGWLSPAN